MSDYHGQEDEMAAEFRTKTGRVLTDQDIEALADEAERGYDVTHLQQQQRPMANMDHIARHVIWDRQKFARERGHDPGSGHEVGHTEAYEIHVKCSRCDASLTVMAVKEMQLVITDTMTVRECPGSVEGHKLEGSSGTADGASV